MGKFRVHNILGVWPNQNGFSNNTARRHVNFQTPLRFLQEELEVFF